MRYLTEEEKLSRPSKSELKRIAQETNKFVTSLLKLSPDQIKKTGLPEDIANEIIEAKKLKASSARNREVKFISAMIRDDEHWGTSMASKQFAKIAAGKAKLKIET